MNRGLTNAIRYVMDEWIPPAIRDSRIFMYPFFYIWFKGKYINEIMNFKKNVYFMSKQEFFDFYKKRDSMAKDRETDLSMASIRFMLDKMNKDNKTFLDIGCGNGFLLNMVKNLGIETTGCDVFEQSPFEHSKYIQGDIENIPLENDSVDVISACHILEHVLDFSKSISEIKRVAAKQVIVVVPCQKYYMYTLDEHINFFPFKEKLIYHMDMENYICEVIQGDLVYIGTK